MTHPNMDSDKILDVYIHDYLVKRRCNAAAEAFQAEAEVSTNQNVIEAPGGFLFEWWSVFWDTFIARYKRQASVESNNQQQCQWQIQMLRQIQQQREEEDSRQQIGSPRHSFARQNSQNLNSLDAAASILDSNYASILKAVGLGGQTSR